MAEGLTSTAVDFDNLLAAGDGVVTDYGTLAAGENVVRGEVLGKVTADGKLRASVSTETDGSEAVYAVAAEAVDASAGDEAIGFYIRGQMNQNAMTFGGAHTPASTKDAFRALGIDLRAPLQTSGQA